MANQKKEKEFKNDDGQLSRADKIKMRINWINVGFALLAVLIAFASFIRSCNTKDWTEDQVSTMNTQVETLNNWSRNQLKLMEDQVKVLDTWSKEQIKILKDANKPLIDVIIDRIGPKVV